MSKTLILQVNVPMQHENKKEEVNREFYKRNDTDAVSYVGERGFKYQRDLYALSEYQARQYAIDTGSDYLQINDCSFMPGFHPIWQRFKMFELTQYDQILYLDMDAIVLPNIENIFELYKDYEFSAVPNQEFHRQTATIQNYLKADQARYNSSDKYHPFCSGVMLMRSDWLAKTKLIYEKYIDRYKLAWHDQGVLNSCIIEQGEQYNELSYHWGAWNKSGDNIVHLSGPRKNTFDLNNFCKRFNINYWVGKKTFTHSPIKELQCH
jgi:hypothetical protein